MTKMGFQESVMSSIEELFHDNTLISISGKGGTGKTTLSLFLVGNFLTSLQPYGGSCIWVQASESFSKRRLNTLFRKNTEQLAYVTQNIFITPGHGPFSSYDLQLEGLKKLSENNYLLPPDIKFLVIDNISHHLRFKLSQVPDMEQRSNLINIFYDSLLNPLIFRCQRENINLILIHEVSFDVKSQRTRPFFSKLYERISGVHINLSNSFVSNQRTLELVVKDRQFSFNFILADNGFTFSK